MSGPAETQALVGVETGGGTALVTLQRPDKRNALSIELRVELADALDGLARDEKTGCIVLTGAGPAFCSGMDTTQFGGDREHKRALVDTSERLFDSLARCPKPTIAAVNGPALAGGFALALVCDLRLASPAATFGFPELGRHIPPSYAAARAALSPAVARELCLTGRVIDANEALRLGVVSELCEADALVPRTLALAREIAAAPRGAILEIKRRVLLEADSSWGALLAEEGRLLRDTLLGA